MKTKPSLLSNSRAPVFPGGAALTGATKRQHRTVSVGRVRRSRHPAKNTTPAATGALPVNSSQ
ncbi:hypothetical protein FFB58_05170 [Enterobacter sp. MF024]|nr:hypothetical protein FFB58_05170 [Enterobacter sp. MF024]